MKRLSTIAALIVATGVVYASDLFDLTDTWDSSGTTFNAIKMDVDDQASAADSRLLYLLKGGSDRFQVGKSGDTTIWGGLVVNENGQDTDFRVESQAETSMLRVDSSDNQVVVHGSSDPDYGSLFVLGRTTGSGADNDIHATFGEDEETVNINSGNTGSVSLVQFQTPSITSNNPASPASLDNVRIEGAPDDSDANVTPTEKHALNVEEGDTIFQPFDVDTDGQIKDSPDIKIRGKYDSDTGGGVTSANRNAALRHNVTAGGSSPASQLDVDIDGTTVASLDDAGNLDVTGDLQVGGTTTLRSPGTSTNPGTGFDTWRQISATRPAQVQLEIEVDPTGTTAAQVDVEVDESGGTTADYAFTVHVPAGLGANRRDNLTIVVPAGAQYRINNVANPDSGNSINVHREFTF